LNEIRNQCQVKLQKLFKLMEIEQHTFE
jgi:hypothetical protein